MDTVRRLLVLFPLIAAAGPARAAEPPTPRVVAHRGLLGHAPENTLGNFRACLELRLGFEFDIRRTKDGRLVCLHDDTVDRTTDGTGRVAELTLEQVRRLDAGRRFAPEFAGERVPTVEEVFQLAAGYRRHDVVLAVDLKVEGVEAEVVRLARKHEVLEKLLFIGTTISEPRVRENLRRADAKAHTAALAGGADELARLLAGGDADWVYLRFLPTAEQVRAAHGVGKRVFIAGPKVAGNLPENWREAAAAGADGILTDFPLDFRAALRSKAAPK